MWTYCGPGKEARLDITESRPFSGDLIDGPFWMLEHTCYWTIGEGDPVQSITYEEVADNPASERAQRKARLIAWATKLNPRAVAAALDPGAPIYSEERSLLVGKVLFRDVRLQFLREKAVGEQVCQCRSVVDPVLPV